jgi:hypothetical protein
VSLGGLEAALSGAFRGWMIAIQRAFAVWR